MEWNGKTFTGNPIDVKWADAKNLFGKGEFTGKTRYGRLNSEELDGIRYEKGFDVGKCYVTFSGNSDWRLATAHDWKSIQFMSDRFDYPDMERDLREEHLKKLFPYSNESQCFWTATGKWHPLMGEHEDLSLYDGIEKFFMILEKVFIKIHRILNLQKFQDSGYTAWACDFRNNVDADGEAEFPVMLVRNV